MFAFFVFFDFVDFDADFNVDFSKIDIEIDVEIGIDIDKKCRLVPFATIDIDIFIHQIDIHIKHQSASETRNPTEGRPK